MRTRSPAVQPRSRSSCANRLVCSASPVYVISSAASSRSTITAVRVAMGVPRCASVQATPMLKCSGMAHTQGGNGCMGRDRSADGLRRGRVARLEDVFHALPHARREPEMREDVEALVLHGV